MKQLMPLGISRKKAVGHTRSFFFDSAIIQPLRTFPAHRGGTNHEPT
jgi:hypothetical protein